MGSETKVQSLRFCIYEREDGSDGALWNVLTTAGRETKMEKRAEMRGRENESGVEKPLVGAVSSHVIPLIAF